MVTLECVRVRSPLLVYKFPYPSVDIHKSNGPVHKVLAVHKYISSSWFYHIERNEVTAVLPWRKQPAKF